MRAGEGERKREEGEVERRRGERSEICDRGGGGARLSFFLSRILSSLAEERRVKERRGGSEESVAVFPTGSPALSSAALCSVVSVWRLLGCFVGLLLSYIYLVLFFSPFYPTLVTEGEQGSGLGICV